MKPIKELTDKEKSILLAKLIGYIVPAEGYLPGLWQVVGDGLGVFVDYPSAIVPNLYDAKNFSLAWRVLNWWHSQERSLKWYWGDLQGWFTKPVDDVIREWLDLVLRLAIDAGLLEE